MTSDMINAVFEGSGALLTAMNTRRVYTDKGHAGIYVPAVVFFFSWGGWNLWFYPSLGQMWSFVAGAALFAANLAWVSMLVWYGPVQKRDW